jgi:hypothetical protein
VRIRVTRERFTAAGSSSISPQVAVEQLHRSVVRPWPDSTRRRGGISTIWIEGTKTRPSKYYISGIQALSEEASSDRWHWCHQSARPFLPKARSARESELSQLRTGNNWVTLSSRGGRREYQVDSGITSPNARLLIANTNCRRRRIRSITQQPRFI